jgi:hypothetical protein
VSTDIADDAKLDVFVRWRTLLSMLLLDVGLVAFAAGLWSLPQYVSLLLPGGGPILKTLRLTLLQIGFFPIGLVVACSLLLALILPFAVAGQVWRKITRQPTLRVDREGVWCRDRADIGIIPWSDIQGAQAVTTRFGLRQWEFLCLKLRNEEKYRCGIDIHANVTSRVSLPDFPLLPMPGLTPPALEVAAFINRMVAREYRASARSDPARDRSGGESRDGKAAAASAAPNLAPPAEPSAPQRFPLLDMEMRAYLSLVPESATDQRLTFVLSSVFGRDELVLDLAARTYRFSRGTELEQGSLDPMTSVCLVLRVLREGKVNVPVWLVVLGFSGEIKVPPVAHFKTEQEAYPYFFDLARRLRVTARDLTGELERRTPWTEIGQPLLQRRLPPARPPSPTPPEKSRLRISGEPPNQRIILPRPGWLPILGFGALAFALWFLVAATLYKPKASFAGPALSGLGAVALLFGSLAKPLLTGLLRIEIRANAEKIGLCYRLFGIALSWRVFPKTDIVDVGVKPMPLDRKCAEVQLRTADKVMTWQNGKLSAADRQWLDATLLAMVRAASPASSS